MQNSNREFGELAVLDEFTEVRKGLLLAIADELDHIEDSLDDSAFEVVAALVAKDTREEREHGSVFSGEFEAERADGVDDDNLELVADLAHEARDLFHETIHRGFISGLK